jgi:hypothetical protein
LIGANGKNPYCQLSKKEKKMKFTREELMDGETRVMWRDGESFNEASLDNYAKIRLVSNAEPLDGGFCSDDYEWIQREIKLESRELGLGLDIFIAKEYKTIYVASQDINLCAVIGELVD